MKSNEPMGHGWVREQLDAYVTGGITGADRDRFETHVVGCPDCAKALEEATALDKSLRTMFADARPTPGFEDRIIQGLRMTPEPRVVIPFIPLKALTAVAAALLIGFVGFFVSGMIENENASERAKYRKTPGTPVSAEEKSVDREVATSDDVADALASRLRESPSVVDAPPSDKPGSPRGEYGETKRKLSIAAGGLADADGKAEVEEAMAYGRKGQGEAQAMRGGGGGEELESRGRESGDAQRSFYKNDMAKAPSGMPAPAASAEAKSNDYYQPADKLAEMEKSTETLKKSADAGARQPAQDPSRSPKSHNVSAAQEAVIQRKVIKDGEVEFEVEKFDSALVQITKIAIEEGGYIASTESEKLANGKVKGTITVRVPPENLDKMILSIRALGELKSQNVSTKDVTKQYTDTESKLRALRAMESRVLDIIKSGKGEIKDLLQAEQQLAVYRKEIEVLEGEIRYFNNLISLSTLRITLYEKDIQASASATETEYVRSSIQIEDVEKAYLGAKETISKDCKGRITKSELKQYDAGQFQALISCEVPFDKTDELINRLKQLGVARIDRDMRQATTGGTGRAENMKIERKDSVFSISMYNLTNITPRTTTTLSIACKDVEDAYKQILKYVGQEKKGRIVRSVLNSQKADSTTGMIQFEVKKEDREEVLQTIRAGREQINLQAIENPDTNNTTDTKSGFTVHIGSLQTVTAREAVALNVATRVVPDSFRSALESIKGMEAFIRTSQLDEPDKVNATGYLDFDIASEKRSEIDNLLNGLGDAYGRNVSRAQDSPYVVETKIRYQVSILSADTQLPREITTMSIDADDAQKTIDILRAYAQEGGKIVDSKMLLEKSGRITGRLVIDVPFGRNLSTLAKIRELGILRTEETTQNRNVPEDGKLTRARFTVTVSNKELTMPADEGMEPTFKAGMRTIYKSLLWSMNIILIGLIVVVPWLLILWFSWKLVRRSRAKATAEAAAK